MPFNETELAMINCAAQPVSIIQWLISPIFIIFLIYFVCSLPFIILGVNDAGRRLRNWSKVRSGWLTMRKKLSNLHWIYFWVKPTGRKVNIKTEEGIEIELPIEIQEGMLGLEKEISDIHFKSDGKNKKVKQEKFIDIHIEKTKPTQHEVEAAFDVLRRMGK